MEKLSNLDMTYRIRYQGRKINIFERVDEIKKQLKEILPEIEESRFLSMLSHCRRQYEGNLYHGRRTTDKEEIKKRPVSKLTESERIIYEFLLKNNLNPSTSYRWFLAVRVPEDIKEKLKRGNFSYKKAMQIAYNRKRIRDTNKGILLLEEMRTIMEGL